MARPHSKTLESIVYTQDSFRLLDQRLLPFQTVYDEVRTVEDVWRAIKEMRVRGAPAIAVSAGLGIATAARLLVDAKDSRVVASVDAAQRFLLDSLDYVATSRPTAVNLFNAVREMKKEVAAAALLASDGPALVDAFRLTAERLYDEDVRFNEGIMTFGAAHIVSRRTTQSGGEGAAADTDDAKGPTNSKAANINVLTICNTGALATSRFGTALGVVRQLHYSGQLAMLYACETRPWNQGARLTAYECVEESIPCTLICDSAAASLMQRTKIDAVIVGADRICRNGDTANKIGTYSLAVAAKHHGVPFYVAAPSTTLDPSTLSGADVVIEERDPVEITHNSITKQRVVAEGPTLSIWNPVFDITPGELITGGIITERGVIEPSTPGVPGAPVFDLKP